MIRFEIEPYRIEHGDRKTGVGCYGVYIGHVIVNTESGKFISFQAVDGYLKPEYSASKIAEVWRVQTTTPDGQYLQHLVYTYDQIHAYYKRKGIERGWRTP